MRVVKGESNDASALGECTLTHPLSAQDNDLGEVPVESLRGLRNLTLLDLSRNHIERVPSGAFASLHSLATLKLADNNLSLAADAFQGLEDTLKNLNLKGTRQKRVPEAIKGLRTLAFLDLAQNGLRELPGPAGAHILEGLHSLSALNLERNLIQSVGETTFRGVSDTLSSLSLLNNLLTDFPAAAVSNLRELRVRTRALARARPQTRGLFLSRPPSHSGFSEGPPSRRHTPKKERTRSGRNGAQWCGLLASHGRLQGQCRGLGRPVQTPFSPFRAHRAPRRVAGAERSGPVVQPFPLRSVAWPCPARPD